MMLASVLVLGLLGETPEVKTQLAIVTAPSRSWADREKALGVLQTLDYREVIPLILPLLPPFGRAPSHLEMSAWPTPITEKTPLDDQVEHCAGELVSSMLNTPLPSEERGRFIVTVLSGSDAEENFGKLQAAMFRHWVPELEKPVLRILKEGRRVDLRAAAADLLVSTASAPRNLPDALHLIRSPPTPEEQARVFLLVFCRHFAALTLEAWTEILRTGLEILSKVSLPRAGALSGQLGNWLHLPLPRYTIHPERGARPRRSSASATKAWRWCGPGTPGIAPTCPPRRPGSSPEEGKPHLAQVGPVPPLTGLAEIRQSPRSPRAESRGSSSARDHVTALWGLCDEGTRSPSTPLRASGGRAAILINPLEANGESVAFRPTLRAALDALEAGAQSRKPMRKIILLAFVASLALAQAKPTPAAPRDAGVTLSRPVAVDAGVPAPVASAPSLEVEKLRKEVAELRLRTVELERQLQVKSDGDFEKLNRKLDGLTDKVNKLSEADDRRSDAEEAAATKKTQIAAASSNLNVVLVQLATGNTHDIDASLRYAESVYTGNAQKDVTLARAAIAQGDVSAARQYLMLALWELGTQR